MRRWILSLALLLGLLAPAAATLTTTNLSGFNAYTTAAPGGTPATITFLQCAVNVANATTYTYSTQNTGTASADRRTLVGIVGEDSATVFGVSSVTVGGDSATEVVDNDGSEAISGAFYILANSSGTSEDVVVTFSEAVTGSAICLWQVNNLTSSTATDTAAISIASGGSRVLTLDLDVSADGVAAGMAGDTGTSNTCTWTGMTERADANTGEHRYTAADYDEDGTASTPLATDCTYTGSSAIAGVSASFR